jgi:septum formation protein
MSKNQAPETSAAPGPTPEATEKLRLWRSADRLILASASAGRRRLLASAGLSFDVEDARIDERALEEAFLGRGGSPDDLAARLARAKAVAVSERNPDALCLGADQTLSLDGAILHKPANLEAAAAQLRLLAGRRHSLVSAFCFARDAAPLFVGRDAAVLTMRALDEPAIRLYLALAAPPALASVGAYQIEGLGIHLFEKIEGDYATIQGLPIMGVLAWLRADGRLSL